MFELKYQRGGRTLSASGKRRVRFLAEGMRNVNTNCSLSSAIEESIKTAKRMANADVGNLLWLNEETGDLSACYSFNDENSQQGTIPKTIGQRVVQQGQLYCSGRFEQFKVRNLKKEAELSCPNVLCLPLINESGRPMGVLQVGNINEEQKFTEEDVIFLDLFSQHVSSVIGSLKKIADLQARANESEILLTEIHHRLKNNLSTITSLIELELPKVADKHSVDVLQKTCSRIKSITEVHNILYQIGGIGDIDLAAYFRKLTTKISKMLTAESETVHIIVEGDNIKVNSEQMMTCGLILNELILNAYKHAFASVEEGEIYIGITEHPEDTIQIEVSDNGKGINNNFALDNKESMGCWVIRALADRINATVDVSSEEGTRYKLVFEK